ncbi:MAG: tRNA dihydrouridine synthase DusB [Chitinispirillaceae bacterium]|nr:tRNA dihydrouridine synthase DusB [Chitinispirillaceae bacterium]
MHFKNNRLIAAPMAGVSDSIFRSLCRENGADIVITEMVSVDGIAYGAEATLELLRFESLERPVGIQLFGADPEKFKRSAAIVAERFQPDFIDLNAGCPVAKVVKKNGGASLLKDLDRFEKIIRAIIEAVAFPVTVKLRSGWSKNQWVDCEFAQCAESRGAAAVILHPRSQTMGFSGHSFWERIAAVKSALSIPVIGNGDVTCAEDALVMKAQTGCDGIMIGRGTYGNPWIFSQVKAALRGEPVCRPGVAQRRAMALRHIMLHRDRYGERRAAKEMKKHVSWYIKGMAGASSWRDRIFRSSSTGELEAVINEAFRD